VRAVKVAALYDVHGNLPALQAVLADPRLADADAIVSGGDLVVGPKPAECMDALEALGTRVHWVRGNCDRETCDPASAGELGDVARWCADRLGDDRLARVDRWPLSVELQIDGLGTALFCHATPTSDVPILTRITPEEDVVRELGDVAADVVVCGHTHVQYDRRIGNLRLVNAGSVGMPYEDSPDARWALLGHGSVVHLQTPYDAEDGLESLAGTGFPLLEQWIGRVARGEVGADEATASFEGRRLGA